MNQEMQDKLIVDNLPLVRHIIKKYIYLGEDEYEDLYQEGCLALVNAAKHYDENNESGAKFSTYAARAILHTLQSYKLKKSNNLHGFGLSDTTRKKIDGSIPFVFLNEPFSKFDDGGAIDYSELIPDNNNYIEQSTNKELIKSVLTYIDANGPKYASVIFHTMADKLYETGDIPSLSELTKYCDNCSKQNIDRIQKKMRNQIKQSGLF